MIEIKNIYKKFDRNIVLNNINLSLPVKGLIAIVGPSGCGKTTLLNCISGLTTYEGSIYVDNTYVNFKSEQEMSKMRLTTFGFVFQDFKLFETESVERNVMLPLEILSNDSKARKERKCHDLVEVVNLTHKIKNRVSKLSGGEKQRVAIARALVNDPKVILADEPTGSLDATNGEEIMKILEKISKKSLVVVVSHNVDLMRRYSDQIITMKDGVVLNSVFNEKTAQNVTLPICKNRDRHKNKFTIPFPFLFHHSLSKIKTHKWRSFFTCMVMSLGLVSIGAANSVSETVAQNIKSVYSSLVDETKIMISIQESSPLLFGRYSGSYFEACEIADSYQNYIQDIGVTYYCDFESFFKDRDDLYVQEGAYHYLIDGISSRNINEFVWLENAENILPSPIYHLNDDEVVFGLTIKMIEDICYSLKIERTVTSLSNYLHNKNISFYFDFENSDWEYSDQQLITMVGFVLQNKPAIYHSNHTWNEYMFENCMRFPTSDTIDQKDEVPWKMKKIYYFETGNKTDDFLRESFSSPLSDTAVLEIADSEYYPWLYKNAEFKDLSRVLFFSRTKGAIPPRFGSYFKENAPNLSNEIFCSPGGYSAFPSSMMIGFSKPIYFSFSEESLNQTVDGLTRTQIEFGEMINLPTDVVSGHYSQTSQNGVIFRPLISEIAKGELPRSLDEIVISTGMAKVLFNKLNVINKILHLAFTSSERVNSQGDIMREFVLRDIKVVGLIESPKMVLFHEPYWSIGFFQSRLGVSGFDLLTNTVAYDVKKSSKINETISLLTKAFPQYSIVNPLSQINQSVDQVCKYIELALSIFSIASLIISSLLLTISNYLHIYENRRDIGLSLCLGVNKKEAKKFLFCHSFVTGLISFCLSILELLIINIILSRELSLFIHADVGFAFSPLSLVYMLLLFSFVTTISTYFTSKNLALLSPLDALKS